MTAIPYAPPIFTSPEKAKRWLLREIESDERALHTAIAICRAQGGEDRQEELARLIGGATRTFLEALASEVR